MTAIKKMVLTKTAIRKLRKNCKPAEKPALRMFIAKAKKKYRNPAVFLSGLMLDRINIKPKSPIWKVMLKTPNGKSIVLKEWPTKTKAYSSLAANSRRYGSHNLSVVES